MIRLRSNQAVDRWQTGVGWFLTLSYVVGSPIFAVVEANTGVFSDRFGYSSGFLYLVSAVQLVSGSVLFVRFLAPWSIAVLTILAIGAVVSHVRIDSPLTGLPALGYTALQIWYGVRIYGQNRGHRSQ